MKLLINIQDSKSIKVRDTIIKLNVNPFDSDGNKVPLSMYSQRGDILVGRSNSNPIALKVQQDGQVLVADSTAPAGVRWKVLAFGTITLENNSALPVLAGTVVTITGMPSGDFRVATSADTQNLFVAAENIGPGEFGVIYSVSGKDCSVRADSAAINPGDKLTVSSSPGLATKTTGETYFAQAITGKAAGSPGSVICVLVNTLKTIIPIEEGGTGAPTAEQARTNLGITPANIGALPINNTHLMLGKMLPSTAGHGGAIYFHFNGSSTQTLQLVEYVAKCLSVYDTIYVNDSPPNIPRVRNIRAGTAPMTPGVSALKTGEIYIQYE